MENEILWHIRRTECGKELRSEDVAKNFTSHETAHARLEKIAEGFGSKNTQDSHGCDVILLTEGKEAVLYWIYGEPKRLGKAAPNICARS